jgi:CBS domain containing-hemolysin-like protein
MRIDDFNENFKADIPSDGDYETLAGFLNEKAGHIPNLGEEIRHGNFSFKITKKSPKQIQQVKLIKLEKPKPADI